MQLGRKDKRSILDAMTELNSGDSRRFNDILWLSFGDSWKPIRQLLISRGLVRIEPQEHMPAITDRGTWFVQRSIEHMSGIDGRNVA